MKPRALIADPSLSVSGALRRQLESAGFEVRVVHYLDEAVERIRAREPELVFAAASATFDGETLCQKAKSLQPGIPVVLVYPPEEEDPEPHAARAGADSWLVGPLKRASVVSCARAMLRIKQLGATVERLEAELRHKTEAARAAAAPTTSGGAATKDFEFFKRFLLMEVKRSRRYRYPVSFLMVALDRFAERAAHMSPVERTACLAEAFGTVARGTRDIDLSVPFGDERFLVFLPHTPREGALIVAERLRTTLAQLRSLPECTASIGVAAFEPAVAAANAQVSFGSLMKDATEALKRAQARGGNAVEANSAAERKRDRISIG
ncbi:MAG: diguanylate cyclase [Myxococcaceae bacterium]|nr:diguanylate cyclase [Myxococcaceae bacterium]